MSVSLTTRLYLTSAGNFAEGSAAVDDVVSDGDESK